MNKSIRDYGKSNEMKSNHYQDKNTEEKKDSKFTRTR